MRILVLLLLLAALSGCFGDDGDDAGPGGDDGSDEGDDTDDGPDDGTDDGTDDGGAGDDNETDEPRAPVTWTVDVGDNSFSDSDLTIQAGDTVEWVQSGTNPHTVTEDDGDFDSHPDCEEFQDSLLGNCMEEGDTFEQTFDAAGEVGYYCKIHGSPGSGMSGTITVQEVYDETPEA